MSDARVNGGQDYNRRCALAQVEAKSSGGWRWLLPGDPFHAWKLICWQDRSLWQVLVVWQ